MAFLSWRDEFCVGVGTIDAQHRHLADLVNRIEEDLLARASADALRNAFRDLAEATAAHFQHEEDLIAGSSFADESRHKRKHAALLWTLRRFEYDLDRDGGADYLESRLEFLRRWLLDHILEEDMPLAAHLKAAGAAGFASPMGK